ncbi:hypothetical protein ABEB36_000550 [Hypothenemus hampei]|uniref:Transcription factor Adf-1 n=1 Tax=Hypothenemus hampei TaxID=57062 RepID=A0ABD1FBN3_HYPHA
MDVEKFIKLIQEHKCLWDQSDSTYNSRDHQGASWRKISNELKIPENDLKIKWRGLRDSFGRKLKILTKQSDEGTESKIKWRYFKMLMFLNGNISRREFKSNTSDICEDMESHERWDSSPSTSFDAVLSPAALVSSQASLQNHVKISNKTFKNSLRDKLEKSRPLDDIETQHELQVEKKRLKCFEEIPDNSDAQFLMSLLPYLNDIPKQHKLIVRGKLQKVLIDEGLF